MTGGTAPGGELQPGRIDGPVLRRVVDTDYEPADWDGFRFSAYGAFTAERMGYARNYGMTDDKHHRFITRYNIWDRSHYYDDPDTMTGPVECYTPDTTPVQIRTAMRTATAPRTSVRPLAMVPAATPSSSAAPCPIKNAPQPPSSGTTPRAVT